MEEILSSGNPWYGNWIAKICVLLSLWNIWFFFIPQSYQISMIKSSFVLENENLMLSREREKHKPFERFGFCGKKTHCYSLFLSRLPFRKKFLSRLQKSSWQFAKVMSALILFFFSSFPFSLKSFCVYKYQWQVFLTLMFLMACF